MRNQIKKGKRIGIVFITLLTIVIGLMSAGNCYMWNLYVLYGALSIGFNARHQIYSWSISAS